MQYRTATRVFLGVLVSSLAAACLKFGPAPAQVGDHLHFAGERVRLNTSSDGRHAFVTGHVGERGPLNFIVDTGSAVNVIDSALAKEMGLEKIGEMQVLSGGVEPVTADIVVVPQVRIDNLTIKDAEFLTMELGAMSLGLFQGVLGMGLFREALIVFNPGQEFIAISQAELSASDAGVMVYDKSAQSGFRIDIDVAGAQVPMTLDTGAPSGFTFPLALSATVPLQGELTPGPVAQLVGGQRSIQLGTLDGQISFGNLKLENPQVAFIDPSPPHGNIGNAVLGDLVLSIDQKNGLLALSESHPPEVSRVVAADTGKPRRLGIQLRALPPGNPPTVTMVEPDSLGERAGIRVGDILMTLNEQPMKELSLLKLRPLFRGSTPLRFEVERNGEIHIVEIH